MNRSSSTRVVVVLGAALLLLTGCAPQAPDAQPVDGVDCTATITPGRIPDGFDPVAAYVCDDLGGFEDAAGRWSATTVQRLEGDLAPLVDAFREGSDPRWLGPCTTIGIIVPGVWLVDADGAAIRLAYPVNGCGQPKTTRIAAALDALTVVAEEHLDARLQESAAALAAGCSTRGETLRIATGLVVESMPPSNSAPDLGIATIPVAPLPDPAAVSGARVCRYDTDVAVPGSTGDVGLPELGTFTDATELDREGALVILEAAAYEVTPAIACDPAARYALVHFLDAAGTTLGLPVQIELSGCERLSTGSGFTLAAEDVLALVSG